MQVTTPKLEHLPDWIIIQGKIVSYFTFQPTKSRFLEEVALSEVEKIENSFDHIQFFQEYLVDEFTHLFASFFQDAKLDFDYLSCIRGLCKGVFLTLQEQNQIALFIEGALKIARSSTKHALNPLSPVMGREQIQSLGQLIKDFRHLINKQGEVDYLKHPELSVLFHKLNDQEAHLRRRMQEYVKQDDLKTSLQFDSWDIVDDRYVLPIRSDAYNAKVGLIVSRSDSGSTLWVEPYDIRDHAGKRLETLSKIKEIIFQIEAQFFKRFSDHHSIIQSIAMDLTLFDEYLGKSRFCLALGLSRPQLKQSAGFHFDKIFHPLLKNPIRNDVYLETSQIAIVLSGPNTGGKTALLKSIALAYKFFLHGLFVPALNAEMFPYESIHFIINDLQDITQGLSSFSGEALKYLDLSDQLQENNLILIDEIFNSTSSEEASALALAMIDVLNLRKKTHFLISTHHQLLKLLATERHNILSGSMGFDISTMKPTYRFFPGIPGQSMAIEIFDQLSKSHTWGRLISDEAKNLIDKKQVNFEKLLAQVAEKNRELDEMIHFQTQRDHELNQREKALEGLVQLRLQSEVQKFEKAIDDLQRGGEDLIRQIRDGDIQKERKFLDKLAVLKNQTSEQHQIERPQTELPDLEENSSEESLAPHLLKVGNYYLNTFLKKDVQLKSIDWRKRQAVVIKGHLTVTVPLNTFRKGTTTSKSFQQIRISVHRELNEARPYILDCRGMRLEEFQHLVERGLADLLAGELPFLNVIHGHGDGILKSWLRSTISKNSNFRWSIPENGNDGETEIRIRE